jgi:rfaE bifunctional protein nucleotidyltransferase chain/domain
MKISALTSPILSWQDLAKLRDEWREQGYKVVFTNGVFDIVHRGHVDYLLAARSLGDRLIVGLNTDASVKRFKDPRRPIVTQEDRAFVLSCLRFVDALALFDQDTPLKFINYLMPDVLVKGADYKEEDIVGAREVKAYGGTVERIALTEGKSTSQLIQAIIEKYQKK